MTHPSDEIFCEKSDSLMGKVIVMGITGSIAAVECFGTIRELIRRGAEVIPVMTDAAKKLVTPDSLYFASGNAPVTELTGLTEHITLMGDIESADLLLIYPATANTISKIANGIDDTPVTSMATVAMGSGIPIAVAPAMHQAMFDNPAVAENIEKLKDWGLYIIGPRLDGTRAKVATSEEVVETVERLVNNDYLTGEKVLVIGGRSEEPIDSMRLITNRSSGLMAVTLAKAAFRKGAEVELWMGGCNVQIPSYIPTRRFSTVTELIDMVDDIDHDIVIVPAALADFSPADVEDGKIVGAILCGHDGRRAWLYHVCVSEEYRMHGIGKKMVEFCCKQLKKEKINKVCLNAFVTNSVGNKFWQKMGWTLREDLNYYDFALNEDNLTIFNK